MSNDFTNFIEKTLKQVKVGKAEKEIKIYLILYYV